MSGDHNMYASGSGDGQRSGWRKRTIMEMANETLERMEPDAYCREPYWSATDDELKAFVEQVRADERNRTWTQEHWTEYENSIAAAEREACAKTKAGKPRELKAVGRGTLLGEQQFCFDKGWREGAASVRAAIRARGEQA